mmetsp:Transcript_60171/g.138020  ORF Transcript_60171/g.138020 Transcript_60171/m.138020 type:complete len:340 (-) Transcript_60171:157-1176(-)|eukprot:CAMPEP_0119359336 /NCGR_PEP_ID=MMETSP1334-20130426/7251_1 /TAXON_ID=127549 /ORGANISM="Calcidiscus leptoporus, Strain RCC1130" /LENGTH=339 /DNA_ID=CAMNT_0007373991 /DNA_START=165 /DNA_END=1184 /DNA_ORIENTATION=-
MAHAAYSLRLATQRIAAHTGAAGLAGDQPFAAEVPLAKPIIGNAVAVAAPLTGSLHNQRAVQFRGRRIVGRHADAAVHCHLMESLEWLGDGHASREEDHLELAAPRSTAPLRRARDARFAEDLCRGRKAELFGMEQHFRAARLADVQPVAVVGNDLELEATHARDRAAGALDDAQIHPLRVDLDELDGSLVADPLQKRAQRDAWHLALLFGVPAPLQAVAGLVDGEHRGAASVGSDVERFDLARGGPAIADRERKDQAARVVVAERLESVAVAFREARQSPGVLVDQRLGRHKEQVVVVGEQLPIEGVAVACADLDGNAHVRRDGQQAILQRRNLYAGE